MCPEGTHENNTPHLRLHHLALGLWQPATKSTAAAREEGVRELLEDFVFQRRPVGVGRGSGQAQLNLSFT